MYWMRVGLFALVRPRSRYVWHNWIGEFGYEYLKDFRSYMLIVVLIYLYRFVRRRLQGEAGFLAEDDTVVPISRRFRQDLRERLS